MKRLFSKVHPVPLDHAVTVGGSTTRPASRSISRQRLIIIAAIFAAIGTIIILKSFAATSITSLEAENINQECQNSTTVINNTDASGGKAVEFGTSSSPASLPTGLQNWSDPATWGGNVPAPGQDVTIPAGKSILMDKDYAQRLGNLTVNGKLYFAANQDRFVRAKRVIVEGDNSLLQIGTADAAIQSKVEIVLDGDQADNYVVGGTAGSHLSSMGLSTSIGANVMAALNGGKIDLHGQCRGKIWAKLAQTAAKGSNTIVLQEPMDFRVGDRLIIASSDINPDHAEEVTITAVAADKKSFTLQNPLAYRHYSAATSITDSGETRTAEERAEVGLLSRNLIIRGPDNAGTTKFGGHTIVLPGGSMHAADLELYHMGQIGVLGKYPFHWHHVGDASAKGDYLKRASIDHSFNRQLTIHQTNNLLADGNVMYDTTGHAISLEDGKETGNQLLNNLIMSVHQPIESQRLIPSDIQPSEFWITNPQNTIVGNSAAGGDAFGFWYDFGETTAFGAGDISSLTGTVNNKNAAAAKVLPITKFDNNIAHSHRVAVYTAVKDGAGYFFWHYKGDTSNRSVANNNSAWKNERFGFWGEGAVDFYNSTMASNARGFLGDANVVRGGLIVGNTANDDANGEQLVFGIATYHSRFDVYDTWFTGFTPSPGQTAVGAVGLTGYDFTYPWVKGLKFFGPGNKVCAAVNKDLQGMVWKDLNGSVLNNGQEAYILHGTNAELFKLPSDQAFGPPECDVFIGPLNGRKPAHVVDDDSSSKLKYRLEGTSQFYDRMLQSMDRRYYIQSVDGAPLTRVNLNVKTSVPGYYEAYFDWPYATARASGYGGSYDPVNSLAEFANHDTTWYWDKTNKKIYIHVQLTGTEPIDGEVLMNVQQ